MAEVTFEKYLAAYALRSYLVPSTGLITTYSCFTWPNSISFIKNFAKLAGMLNLILPNWLLGFIHVTQGWYTVSVNVSVLFVCSWNQILTSPWCGVWTRWRTLTPLPNPVPNLAAPPFHSAAPLMPFGMCTHRIWAGPSCEQNNTL